MHVPGTWLLAGDDPFIYDLNTKGENRWIAIVQRGFDDNGDRTTQAELLAVARKMRAAEEMYEALVQLRSWCIPGMNWTDETGQALLAKADAALATVEGP